MSLIQITAYVRDEADLAKWKSIDNKTQWLHDHLNRKKIKAHESSTESVLPVIEKDTKIHKAKHDVVANNTAICKIHGTNLSDYGYCLQKGCKYARPGS
ncbi:hypothetical protein H0X10_04640 [Candidatus Saccharibacteria bacterium]|nr:hypothetical protein [Candidatus Saccharibacteria bacterium]